MVDSKKYETLAKVRVLRKERAERELRNATQAFENKKSEVISLEEEYKNFIEERKIEEKRLIDRVMHSAAQVHVFDDIKYRYSVFVEKDREFRDKIVAVKDELKQNEERISKAREALMRALSKEQGMDSLVKQSKIIERREVIKKEDDPS